MSFSVNAQSGNHNPAFDLEGHRGCRGLMPENTIPAFLRALELGVTTLELDVVVTGDNQLLISHEPFFNHEISTKPNGEPVTVLEEKALNIYKMDFEEVKRYDVGLKSHPRFPDQQKMAVHKPLLREMFVAVRQYCKERNRELPQFNIEIKSLPIGDNIYHPKPGPFVELLMKLINEEGLAEKVIVQSFDFRSLKYLHKHYPNIRTAALVEDFDKAPFNKQLKKLGFRPDIYSPAFELVTPELVEECHNNGVKLVPWTVNDPANMEKLKAWGVDGLITDYPNRFKNRK